MVHNKFALGAAWGAPGRRKVGHPKTRWSDDIDAFFAERDANFGKSDWLLVAQNREEWANLEPEFAKWKGGK